jgi:hypothetical protein
MDQVRILVQLDLGEIPYFGLKDEVTIQTMILGRKVELKNEEMVASPYATK